MVSTNSQLCFVRICRLIALLGTANSGQSKIRIKYVFVYLEQ